MEGYSHMERLYKFQCYTEGFSNSLDFPQQCKAKPASNDCKSSLFKTDKSTNSFNEACSKFEGFLCTK